MNSVLIARQNESRKLLEALTSQKAELIAVYGRRRVGKTFLVTHTCNALGKALFFQLTGSLNEAGKPIPFQEWLMQFSLAYFASFGVQRYSWR